MARTVDHEAHAQRRDQILDAARRLATVKGFDQMSIQDVQVELGISKGAVYHYFGSKQALLAGLVERAGGEVQDHLAAVAGDPGQDAIAKLEGLFRELASWKTAHRDELVAIIRVWNSDGNALLRQRTRAGIADRLAPLFQEVTEQGVREGAFAGPVPTGFGRVLIDLVQDLNERLGVLFFAYEGGNADLAAVEEAVRSYTGALERLLGVTEGSLALVDLAALKDWFAPKT